MRKCVICSLTYPLDLEHFGWNEKLGQYKVTCRRCTKPRMKKVEDYRVPIRREHTDPMVIRELEQSQKRRVHQEALMWDQFYGVQAGHTKVGRLGAK